ncbi:MAG: hypothetical protein GXX85_10490 [Ignavibacteria bacterium]|nr:hypothetical protein [Ignavibacteria bacterium]
MFAVIFIILGILFFFLVYNAYVTGEVKGRGWGFSIRTYRQYKEPIKFWITFVSYLAAAIAATTFGLLAAYKLIF